MSDNVKHMRDGKHYALESEIAQQVKAVILEYEGRISLVAALGILELVKFDLMPKD